MKTTIYTIGHSSRSLSQLLRLLRDKSVELVVDVRRWPSSKRFPWFNRSVLEEALRRHAIGYEWLGEVLGGYRRFGVDVEDNGGATCFRSQGFRAYALYVTTNKKAQEALRQIEEKAKSRVTTILCMERIPWRCHRKIIADILVLHGLRVVHIIDEGYEVEHRPSRCARLQADGKVVYV
ncbi:MAG: DUF488 family protein [Pyrodictiaceae archaeon]